MRDVDLAPETLAVGIERAITRALTSGQPYVTIPESHLGTLYLMLTEGTELPQGDFCCQDKRTVYSLRGRVTLCTQPSGHDGICMPNELAFTHAVEGGAWGQDALLRPWLHEQLQENLSPLQLVSL